MRYIDLLFREVKYFIVFCLLLFVCLQEIARREEALQQREKNMERVGVGERPNNFPPFPKFCPAPFKPCFYINVKVEVPPAEQWKVYGILGLLICKSFPLSLPLVGV